MELAYKQGDHVRYGMSGVCEVAEVTRIPAPDRRSIKPYYVLRPLAESGTRVYVPLDNPALLGRMAPLMSRTEIEDAIRESICQPMPWPTDRIHRAEAFKAVLKTADPKAILRLCSCIHTQRQTLDRQGKRLSASDEAALKQAERLVEGEFSFSLGIPKEDVGSYIRHFYET